MSRMIFSDTNKCIKSFHLEDVKYWITSEPEFGEQAVLLDARMYKDRSWKPTLSGMKALKSVGVEFIAPPLFALVALNSDGRIVPSDYAQMAKQTGLGIITWTLERSGFLNGGGGWYYQSIKDLTNNDGDVFNLLDVLAQDVGVVGVVGVFSDWPATTTFYANCINIK